MRRARFWLRLARREPLRHVIHYWWNGSRFNDNFEPFASSCSCCCLLCERSQVNDVNEAVSDAS